MTTIDGLDVRSVGNSVVLKETCLIEAFNLKAAIEYSMKTSEPAKVDNDLSAAKEALTDMPPRLESELDPVTLHNQALCHADEDATGAFKKLSYLLATPPYPPEVTSQSFSIYSLIHSLIDLLTHSLTHLLIHLLTHLPPLDIWQLATSTL